MFGILFMIYVVVEEVLDLCHYSRGWSKEDILPTQ